MKLLLVILFVSIATIFEVHSFSLQSNERSKRGIQLICAAELYDPPIANCCKIPVKLPEPALKTCLAAQKVTTLKASEPMCTFDCLYKSQNWINTAGVFDTKLLTSAMTSGVDKSWVAVITNAINNGSKEIANRGAKLKIVSGYTTKCNPKPYIMHNYVLLELYKNCPSASKPKPTNLDTCPVVIGGMSMTCGAFAHFTNVIADATKNAGNAIKATAQEIGKSLPADIKKAVNVNELGKIMSQNIGKLGEQVQSQIKQFKPEDMLKNFFG